MASLNPAESSLSGEHVRMVPVWITRFTVLEPALPEDHPRRVQSRLRRALVLRAVPNQS